MAWHRNPVYPFTLSLILIAIIFFDYFVPRTAVRPYATGVINWAIEIASIAMWVGLINILMRNVRNISTRRPGRWYFSIYEICLIAAILGSGFLEGRWDKGVVVTWAMDNLISPAAIAVTSLMSFWAVRGAYRSFKARNLEAVVFLVVGLILVIGNAPIGALFWGGLPAVGLWFNQIIFRGVWNGLTISMGIGLVAYIARYLIFREKGALGIPEEVTVEGM